MFLDPVGLPSDKQIIDFFERLHLIPYIKKARQIWTSLILTLEFRLFLKPKESELQNFLLKSVGVEYGDNNKLDYHVKNNEGDGDYIYYTKPKSLQNTNSHSMLKKIVQEKQIYINDDDNITSNLDFLDFIVGANIFNDVTKHSMLLNNRKQKKSWFNKIASFGYNGPISTFSLSRNSDLYALKSTKDPTIEKHDEHFDFRSNSIIKIYTNDKRPC